MPTPPVNPKLKDDAASVTFLDKQLARLKTAIIEMKYKPGRILATWLSEWAQYIEKEPTFAPDSLKAYKRGEIVLMDFGFRIGAEIGGLHYAVIIEKNNNPKAGTVGIVPLQSLKPGETVHPTNVALGTGLIPGNPWGSQAIINQMGFFSKQRIIKPIVSPDKIGYVPATKLDEIENRLKAKCCK